MTSPAQRVHDATRRLLELLEGGESTTDEAMAVRGELALATAETGHLEDAWYQAEELVKDAQRGSGGDPDHPAIAEARAGRDEVERIAIARDREQNPT